MQRIKSFIIAQLNTKAPSVHTHTLSEIDDLSSLQMGGGYSKSEVDTLLNDYIPKSGGGVISGTDFSRIDDNETLTICGGSSNGKGAKITLCSKNYTGQEGKLFLYAEDDTSKSVLSLVPNGSLTWCSKNVAMAEDVIPRSGGAVITDHTLGRNVNTSELRLCGGTSYEYGASVVLYGKDIADSAYRGQIFLYLYNGSTSKSMYMFPNGTWTWSGTACQIKSDQRLKQQIAEIDDKLLDAWEDVEPCQFKYNDAVSEKGDKARLHTGYVVQQIDSACKSHGVDVSDYGLYCHEKYAEETEEVEVEQADGTKAKETKVIREASEHYSLRYTEALIVECAYLRRENTRLKQQMQQYNESLNKLEERLKALEQPIK